MKLCTTYLLIAILSLTTNLAYSSTPEAKGLEIAKKMDKANSNFKGEESEMTMTLIDAYGTEIIRKMKGRVKEVKGDGDKSLITFLRPTDVKGTKMLTWSHKTKNDDQWLYLPSMKRIKRISSKAKSSSFMGSEFSYEDLSGQEIEKYTFKHLRDEKSPLGDVWVIERYPVNKKSSGYSKQVMWILKKYNGASKVEYYDRKGKLIKIAEFQNYKSFKVSGKTLWRPEKIHMKNVQTKKQSIFAWDKRTLGKNLKNKFFSKKYLKR